MTALLADEEATLSKLEGVAASLNRRDRQPLDLDMMTADLGLAPRPRQYVRRLGEVARDYVNFSVDPGARVPTGYKWIDDSIKGIAPGEVAVLAAGLYTGKTALMCNIACNNPDTPILFFSLEMPDIMLLARFYAITFGVEFRSLESRIKANAVENGVPLRDSVQRDLEQVMPKLGVCGRSDLSLDGIIEAIDEYEEVFETKPRLIMLDYLELIKSGSAFSEVAGIDGRMIGLRTLGKAKKCGVLVAHQLNREYLSARPGKPVRMSDLRYGGEAQADYLITAYRRMNDPMVQREPLERNYHRSTIHMQIPKNRSGEPQGVEEGHEFLWSPETLKVSERTW